jgi:GH15 family glucan-1,4-alpha-glucosidase
MPSRIEDYALIGDCETAVLVSKGGSIDWLCWPRFDSGACFSELLGDANHGRWSISPAAAASDVKVSRRYAHNTLILETEFASADGKNAVVLVDFMPLREGRSESHVVRLVVGKRGSMAMRTEWIVRFGYGGWVPWVSRSDAGDLIAIAGPDMVVLRTPVELRGEGLTTVGDFVVSAGQRVPFVLTYAPSHLPLPEPIDVDAALRSTADFWQTWASTARTTEPYSKIVARSLITLKALTYAPHGGIIAAPTTSLPEQLGGTRNWDYRFCWLRDATLTLLSLMNAGYYDEARAWRDWLLRAAAGSPDQIQIMYGVTGKRWLAEREVPWLDGYESSKPVRIGNAAADQLQLDVYGEVMDALHHARAGGLHISPPRGSFSSRCSIISRPYGVAPMTAFGRCAASAVTSPIRRSWPGSLSTARLRALKCLDWQVQSNIGVGYAPRSTRRSAAARSTQSSAHSPNLMRATCWTRARS